ncbi:hypothetical protein D3C71_1527130 [compost metagenome]
MWKADLHRQLRQFVQGITGIGPTDGNGRIGRNASLGDQFPPAFHDGLPEPAACLPMTAGQPLPFPGSQATCQQCCLLFEHIQFRFWLSLRNVQFGQPFLHLRVTVGRIQIAQPCTQCPRSRRGSDKGAQAATQGVADSTVIEPPRRDDPRADLGLAQPPGHGLALA